MESLLRRPGIAFAVVGVLVAVVLGGQQMADATLPEQQSASTAEVMGRAGFAYLTGVRTFAAAVLWNRLDPIYHEYYHDKTLDEQVQTLPTIKLVTMLAPDFEDAYNVGAWIVANRGLTAEALQLAREGTEHNPRSGVLRVNYAQILWLYGDDPDEAVAQADIAFEGDAEWRDLFEQHDGYALLRTLYEQNGQREKAQEVLHEIERIDEELGDALPPGQHDHDGDGVPDH